MIQIIELQENAKHAKLGETREIFLRNFACFA